MDHQEIQAVHSVLHLIHHRNKNQHRRAKWWKWLSMLKRTTLDLGTMDSAKTARSYRQHLTSHLIPKCYLAFSTVVANNQFATLGVVLLATLARLVRATGIDYEADVRPQPRAQKPTILVSSKEDRGERVCRNEAGALPKPPKVPTSAPVENSARDNSHTKRGKKASKRKKNAIDELFSGLF